MFFPHRGMRCPSRGCMTKIFPVQTARLGSLLARPPPPHLPRPRAPARAPRSLRGTRRPSPARPGGARSRRPRRSPSLRRRWWGGSRSEPSRPPAPLPGPAGRSGVTCSAGVERGRRRGAHGGAGGAWVCGGGGKLRSSAALNVPQPKPN